MPRVAFVLAALGIGMAAAIAHGGPDPRIGLKPLGRTITTRQLPPASQWIRRDFGRIALALRPPQSRLQYAEACAVDIGTIPEFHCADGIEVPITVGGVKQSTPVPNSACDRPVKLHMAQDGQCVPYTRLVDLSPASRPEVTVLAICRRYEGRPAASPIYDDIAMIAHNRKNGATCFFQSPVHEKPLDGTTVPSPMASTTTASDYWLEPLKENGEVVHSAPGGIACTACHDADPFILSPFIQQVAKLQTWDPKGSYRVDQNGSFAPVAERAWVTAKIDSNLGGDAAGGCLGCHRIGGASHVVIAGGPGGLDGPNFHGFMPPGNGDKPAEWQASYGDAIAALESCLAAAKPPPGCHVHRAGMIP